MNVAIIGSGSWATALAKIVMHNVPEINWYIRKQETIDEFVEIRRNPNHLEWAYFDVSRIHFSADINEVVDQSDLIILAIPSPYIKQSLDDIKINMSKKCVISAVKGMIPDENMLVTDYLHERYHIPEENLGVITGPCHAEEIALERLSYLTVGCKDAAKADLWQKLFDTPYVRTTPSQDVDGLEYASIMKNIYAIAVGMANGLGYGDNFMAVLIANCAAEMSRMFESFGGASHNVLASACLGDLLVTCYSTYSRNRRFGLLIGRGCTVRSAMNEMTMIAEGYYAAKCIRNTSAQRNVEMPIADMVYEVLYHGASARRRMRELTIKLK